MRKLLSAFCLFLATALVTVQTAQAQELSPAKIFSSIGGTTSFDRGGSVHSQARSIYSLGGGMTTFQGKRVSLFAADPPSFSAGCNGISWHFGGFSFISMDEIRRLVEAVAQASVGIAVDLAMQTLCPQCYAVMAKLRDIANAMRNAVADACAIAKNFGDMLSDRGVFSPVDRTMRCSKKTSEDGKTSDILNGVASDTCGMLSKAEETLNQAGKAAMDFLAGKPKDASKKTPDRETLEKAGNITFKALTALGYENGPIKDIMLSLLGMSIQPAVSAPDCREAFKDLAGTAAAEANPDPRGTPHTAEELAAMASLVKTHESLQRKVEATSSDAQPTMGDAKVAAAAPATGGTDKGPTTCFAPPVLAGVKDVGRTLLCGVNVDAEMKNFANSYFNGDVDKLAHTSMGASCGGVSNQASANPLVYTCRLDQADCLQPKMVRLQTLLDTNAANGYTGIVWMVGDALYAGVKKIRANQPLEEKTKKILNGSGYPLYRLLNMAAVYPGMTEELLNAYTYAIAAQFAMDTFDMVARIGAQPTIGTPSVTGLTPQSVSVIREQIMTIAKDGDSTRLAVLERLAEKRKIIQVILEVNKALQAEVIGQGLGGNAKLAVSLKQQIQASAKPKP